MTTEPTKEQLIKLQKEKIKAAKGAVNNQAKKASGRHLTIDCSIKHLKRELRELERL